MRSYFAAARVARQWPGVGDCDGDRRRCPVHWIESDDSGPPRGYDESEVEMSEQAGSVDRATAGDPGRVPLQKWVDEPIIRARDILPIAPNLFATFAGFVALMAAPFICLQIHQMILEDAIDEDRIAGLFVEATLEQAAVIAVVGSFLFLVIGIILQAWQYHRPFPSGWPVVLAFPIAVGLLLPETLLRGGMALTGAIVGVAIAAAFGVHWVVLVILREELD
jgi:hypothetical protein